jgi:putative FmdB family regulatory protein
MKRLKKGGGSMPVYEYKCDQCGSTFERLLMHSDEEVSCPAGHSEVQRLMSTFSVDIPLEECARLPKGEERELCTECRQGGGACPYTA